MVTSSIGLPCTPPLAFTEAKYASAPLRGSLPNCALPPGSGADWPLTHLSWANAAPAATANTTANAAFAFFIVTSGRTRPFTNLREGYAVVLERATFDPTEVAIAQLKTS